MSSILGSKDEKLAYLKTEIESVGSRREAEDLATDFQLYNEALEIDTDKSSESKVLFKIDLVLIPIMCLMYTMQSLDKGSLNYAAAYTLEEDLNLIGQRYSWVAAIFNFGYLFWAIPSNYIIQKVPVAKYTGCTLIIWSIILIAHVGAKNYGGLLVLRFILGMFEAGISPSCMMICSLFYTRSEQPLRICLFLSCNGVAAMVGGLLGYGLGHVQNSHLKTWQLIFLVFGFMNLAVGIIVLVFLPDSPRNARFLNSDERAIAIERVARNNMGIKDKEFKKAQLKESISDVAVWLLSLGGFACGVINGGTSNFASALFKGFGFSGIYATLLQLPTGALELGVVLAAGVIALTVKNTRCLMYVLTCIPGFAGLIIIHTIPLKDKWTLVGGTWLQFIIGGPIVLSWVLLSANIAGHTKRTIANGVWFTFYAAGNITGPNLFYTYEAPKYYKAIIALMTCYSGLMLIGIVYAALLWSRNNKKDKEYGELTPEAAKQAIIDGFKDLTDKENKGFRYLL